MQLKWPMRWDLFSLFPAYAGVIPENKHRFRDTMTFPRIRGGDPSQWQHSQTLGTFSPHTRG